jgi:hypothetical protein
MSVILQINILLLKVFLYVILGVSRQVEVFVLEFEVQAEDGISPVQLSCQKTPLKALTRNPARPGSPDTKLVAIFASNIPNKRAEILNKTDERVFRFARYEIIVLSSGWAIWSVWLLD